MSDFLKQEVIYVYNYKTEQFESFPDVFRYLNWRTLESFELAFYFMFWELRDANVNENGIRCAEVFASDWAMKRFVKVGRQYGGVRSWDDIADQIEKRIRDNSKIYILAHKVFDQGTRGEMVLNRVEKRDSK